MSHPPGIEGLVEAELGLPASSIRPGGGDWLVHPPKDLFGLALSGGGIRSATYNLGVVQALQRLNLLGAFDYVSTVSGGGYLGGFWSAWRRHHEPETKEEGGRDGAGASVGADARPLAAAAAAPAFPPQPDARTGAESLEIRHLREFSNFLSPRMGLFSYDTGRMLVAALGGMLPSLLAAFAVLVIVLAGWGAAASQFIGIDPALDGQRVWVLLSRGVFATAAIAAVVLLCAEVVWGRRGEDAHDAGYWVACAAGLTAAVGAWMGMARLGEGTPAEVAGSLPFLGAEAYVGEWLLLGAPALAWFAAFVVLLFLRFYVSRFAGRGWGGVLRRGLERAASRFLLLAAVWTVVGAIWAGGNGLLFLMVALPAAGAGWLSLPLAVWLQTRLQKMVGREQARPGVPKLSARMLAALPKVLAYPIVATMALGCMMLMALAHQSEFTVAVRGTPYTALVLGAVVVTLGTLLLYQPEQVGLHAFYRSRLARAFLGAARYAKYDLAQYERGDRVRQEAIARLRRTEEDAADDVRLDELPASGPVHLICCAANDLKPADPLEAMNRGARSAVLSRAGFSVGRDWAAWPEGGVSVPTLGAAITASGAAFNSNMGSKSVYFGPASTFVMAAFGLRLGLWLTHPKEGRPLAAQARKAPPRKRVAHRIWRRRKGMVGLPFYKELFGLTSAAGSDVHLSDGAHFENNAVYELIRRHCRVIVASDCGQDVDRAFDDMGILTRRVRIDFGVDLRIDLSPLRLGADGNAQQHMVAGDIHYPDGDTGVLLVFKPALVGSEPVDVGQYRTRNPLFPQQTTVDQFYDEAQWEAYRRLGEHAGMTALRHVADSVDGAQDGSAEAIRRRAVAVFAAARREWLAPPPGAADRLPRLADGIAGLDDMLRQPGCTTLLHEIYPELAAIGGSGSRFHMRWMQRSDGPGQPLRVEDAGARPDAGHTAAAGEWDDEALTLHVIRKGLTFLYERYQCENLERNHGHPMYLGLMNYAARWTSSALVAFWWPLLKPTFPLPFARFLERRLGLEPRLRHTCTVRVGVHGGYAWEQWVRERETRPDAGGRVALGYDIGLVYGDAAEPTLTVQVAILSARMDAGVLVWNADDLFVPAGFWGVGIGGEFVQAVARQAEPAVNRLLVHIPANPCGSAAEKRTTAMAMQLYRSYGFAEVGGSDGATLTLPPPAEEPPPPPVDRATAGHVEMALVR